MPIELNTLEQFDVISEIQFPDYIYSIDSPEEQISFCQYISSLSGRRTLLIHYELFALPFVLTGMKENQIETIFKEGPINLKRVLISNFSNPKIYDKVLQFTTELDRRNKTTENSTRLKNILQYLKDNKYIV